MKKWACFILVGLVLSLQAGEKPGAAIFDQPTLLALRIQISKEAEASLRREPRKAIAGSVMAGTNVFERVAIHLKGGQGSFRPLDEKPALTLNFSKHISSQRCFGLRKIHLNNSAQDPTYLCEDLSGELFRRAGVPAPRTAWATVELNGRKLGLFVLKEGFTKDFLKLHFKDADGNLYDGGLHREVNEPLELDSGDGPRDHADLQALATAAAEVEPKARWNRLQQTLDLDRFVSFMAMEILAGHIDGYCLMQNNYRIYFPTDAKRAVFLPHGTDRMFGDPEAPLEPPMKALMALSVLNTSEGQARYRRRVADLAEQVFDPAWMTNRINAAVKLLEPVEPLVAREAGPLRERIIARAAYARAAAAKFQKQTVPAAEAK